MEQRIATILALAGALVLSGCIGNGEALNASSIDLPGDVEPTGVTVELRAWVETVQEEVFPGYTAEMWAFCFEGVNDAGKAAVHYYEGRAPCSVPGPTLRIDQGDRVVVHFENPHDFPHTIHWHGQYVPNGSDGVPGVTQDTVTTGDTFTYDYIATRSGTLWYHCHVDTQHHLGMGLYGTVIVTPQDASREPEVDQDVNLVLSHGNLTHMAAGGGGHGGHGGHSEHVSGQPGQANTALDWDYDLFMLNGLSFPRTLEDPDTRIDVVPGELVRIRMTNAGFLSETMHLHGHDMLVTHKDGLPLPEDAAFWVDTLRIDPGERYDVLVKMDNPGNWVFHTHYANHVTNAKQYPGGMLTRVAYAGFEDPDFAGELPGGSAASADAHAGHDMGGSSVEVPDDFSATEGDDVTDTEYTRDFDLPVEDVPADQVKTTVALQLSLNPGIPTDELTMTLFDADGNELQKATATSSTSVVGIRLTDPDGGGMFRVNVAGQGVQASYTLNLLVDYEPAPAPGEDPHAGHH